MSMDAERKKQIESWVAAHSLPTGQTFGVHAAAELLREVDWWQQRAERAEAALQRLASLANALYEGDAAS